jgi:hypothetical protein
MIKMLKKEIIIGYICQFCGRESPPKSWKDNKCPKCGREYSWLLAQDSEE